MNLLGLFLKRRPSLVGVDICSTSVKVLALSQKEGRYRVDSYSIEPLPEGAVVQQNIEKPEEVGQAIIRAINNAGVKSKYAVVAIPSSLAMTKTISLPYSMSDGDMFSEIEAQSEKHIPHPLEEVSFDFSVLEESPDDDEMVDVFLAGSRSEDIEGRILVIEESGLLVKVVDIESCAIENAYGLLLSKESEEIAESDTGEDEPAGKKKSCAIVDIGNNYMTLSVIRGNRTVYTRSQEFGGQQLNEELQRRYGYEPEEIAEKYKTGDFPDEYNELVMPEFRDAMTRQISRSLQFYITTSNAENVDQIIIAGGCASVPGIIESVEAKLNIPTSIADPFSDMEVSAKVDKEALKKDAPAMLIVSGLALRSFQ